MIAFAICIIARLFALLVGERVYHIPIPANSRMGNRLSGFVCEKESNVIIAVCAAADKSSLSARRSRKLICGINF